MMPGVDSEETRNVVLPGRKKKAKKKRYGAVGRGADTTPTEPKTRGTAFTAPGSTAPFSAQQDAAQRKVDQARRRLPTVTIAAPPLIRHPTREQAAAGKLQIVRSVQAATAGLHGAERQAAQARILREIGTDPRHAATRRALLSYAAVERATSRPQTRSEARPGPGPTLVGVPVKQASFLPKINLTAARRRLESLTPGLQAGSAEAQFARNALKDVGSLATSPFVGGLAAADIAGDVLTGHPRVAAGKVAGFGKGVLASTVHDIKHPEQAILEHPVLSALNLAGAASVGGRVAGAVARGAGSTVEAGGLRGALARGGATARAPIALTDDVAGGIVERRYSKDLTRKAAQVASDATREPLRHEDGSVVTIRQGGRDVPVLKPRTEPERSRLAKRRGDTVASRANSAERLAREEESGARRIRGVRGRAAKDIVAMVVDGTITGPNHFASDLAAHVKRLRANLQQHESEVRAGQTPTIYRHEGEVDAARRRVELAEKVLNDPRTLAQGKRIVEVATEHARALNANDAEAVAAKLADADELKRARLKVAAVEHLGARHFTEEDHARAEKAARAAGDHALADAVSGKDRRKLGAHRAAQAKVSEARERAQRAAAEQARLEGRVRQMAGAHGVRRGQEAQSGPVAVYHVQGRRHERFADAVTDARAHGLNPRTAIQRVATSAAEARRVGELRSARRSAGAARRRRVEAETELRKAQHDLRRNPDPPRGEGLRTAEGKQLTDRDIEDFLRSRGRDPETVAYLPPAVSRRQFHQQLRASQGRGTLTTGQTRTGAQHEKGATESSAELIRAQGVRQTITLAKARAIDRLVADHGIRHPAWAKAERGDQLTAHERRVVDAGGYFTGQEAAELIDRAAAGGRRVVALRAYPAKLDAETQRIIRDELQGPGAMDALGQRLLNDRFLTESDLHSGRARNVVVMSEPLVRRLDEHLKPASSAGKFWQILNRAFRYSVLPQPRWLVGNFAEPLLVRMPGVGSGVNVFGLGIDVAAAVKTVRAMERSSDPKVRAAAAEIRAHQFGGLLIGQRGASNRRGLEDFPALDADVQKTYGKFVSHLPVMKSMGDVSAKLLRGGGKALLAPLETIFAVNRAGEAVLQRAAFGKSVRREIQEFTGSWTQTVKLGQQALAEAGRGLVNTPTQERFMRAQHELLGKYEGYGPKLRAFIQGPAPFLPWALNAARFVFWTMPAHRSAQTALLVQLNDVVSQDWEQLHANVPPGMKLAVPNGKGGFVDVARFTPYGLSAPLAEGELRGITSQFLPQVSGAKEALEGRDPFGRPLQLSTGKKPGVGDKIGGAVYSLGEALVPYVSTARRLQEGGETAFADSRVWSPRTKSGTSHGMSAARRVFDPLRPTYLTAGGTTTVVEPRAGGGSSSAVPAGVQRALQNQAAGTTANQIPASVQRALQRIHGGDAGVNAIPASVQRALARIG